MGRADAVLRLQRAAGNHAVSELLEEEAERVAAEALTPDGGSVARTLQASTGRPIAEADESNAVRAASSAGHALPEEARAYFESRLGHELTDVRVHTDDDAADAAAAIHARAYTFRNDIVFAAGRFDPASGDGRSLLAHELVHVVQQRADGGPLRDGSPEQASAAPLASVGAAPAIVQATSAGIQRTPMSDEEIAKADEPRLQTRLRENEKEFQNYKIGVQPSEGYEKLQHERQTLVEALRRASPSSTTPAGQRPTYIESLANDELIAALKSTKDRLSSAKEGSSEHATLAAEVRRLSDELEQRRSVYESRLRESLPEWAKKIDDELGKSDRSARTFKPRDFVESMSIERYGDTEFRIFVHGLRRYVRTAIMPTEEAQHWTIGIGVVNFATGESKPESYVEHRSGLAESEGLGPLDYIFALVGVVGVVRGLAGLALRPILRGAGKIYTTAAERALAQQIRSRVAAEAAGPKGVPTPPASVPKIVPRVTPPAPPKAIEPPASSGGSGGTPSPLRGEMPTPAANAPPAAQVSPTPAAEPPSSAPKAAAPPAGRPPSVRPSEPTAPARGAPPEGGPAPRTGESSPATPRATETPDSARQAPKGSESKAPANQAESGRTAEPAAEGESATPQADEATAKAAREGAVRDLKTKVADNQARIDTLRAEARKADAEAQQAGNRAAENKNQNPAEWGRQIKRQKQAADRARAKQDEANRLETENRSLRDRIKRLEVLPCFTADTLVWTPTGRTRIDGLRPGDTVFALDLPTDSVVERAILDVFRNRARHLYDITVGGERIRATGAHRFFIADVKDWVPARSLQPGLRVRGVDGENAIESIAFSNEIDVETFNLSIGGTSNYFVGPGALVHNLGEAHLPFGTGKVYEGINPKFPGKIYIGQTDRSLVERQSEHRTKARARLARPEELTKQQKEFAEFMEGVELRERVGGLKPNQSDYVEQVHMDDETAKRGPDNVMNNREQVPRKDMPRLAEEIRTDPQVIDAGYCTA